VTTPRAIELAVAFALLAAGVVLYRRPRDKSDRADTYGSQGAVILFVVAAIMGIHALGGLDYHPSAAEAELAGRGQ
jgi:hypothetical protein